MFILRYFFDFSRLRNRFWSREAGVEAMYENLQYYNLASRRDTDTQLLSPSPLMHGMNFRILASPTDTKPGQI